MYEALLNFISQLEDVNEYKLLIWKTGTFRAGINPVSKLKTSRSWADLGSAAQGLIKRGSVPVELMQRHQPKRDELGRIQFSELDSREIAHQMTILDFENFQMVQDSELYHLNWKNSKAAKMAPNVLKLVERFNKISFWVVTEIVNQHRLRERVHLIKKFISIAEYCKEINNLNGVMEIIAGLNMFAVQRLKNTWEQIPTKATNSLVDMNLLMDPKNNYKAYRAALQTLKAPLMPYLGVTLRDITFIEEGNSDFVGDSKEGMINLDKLMMKGGVIAEIRQFQFQRFTLDRMDGMQDFFDHMNVLPEEELIEMSLRCEPRIQPES